MQISILHKILSFFKEHPFFNTFLVIVYFLLVVLPHNLFGGWLNRKFIPLGRDTYNLIVITVGAIGLILYFFLTYRGIKQSTKTKKEKNRILGYLVLTVLLVVVVVKTLLVINIEIVHLPQYAILAILIFPIYWDYFSTLFWSVMMGVWDEAYQYWILNPSYNYYDFNDIILDFLGSVLGLLLLAAYGIKKNKENGKTEGSLTKKRINPFQTRPTVSVGLFLFLLASCFAYWQEWLVIYPSPDGIEAPIQMIRNYNPAFWQKIHLGLTYHVVQPLEGVLMIFGLFVVYRRL